jgi:hypothetical protein
MRRAAVAIPSTREYSLRSVINGRDYRLLVSVPERYTADDSIHGPACSRRQTHRGCFETTS